MFLHTVIFAIFAVFPSLASSENKRLPPIQETFHIESKLPLPILFEQEMQLDYITKPDIFSDMTLRQTCLKIIPIIMVLNPNNPIFQYKRPSRVLILERDFDRRNDILKFTSMITEQIEYIIQNYFPPDEIEKQIAFEIANTQKSYNKDKLEKEYSNLSIILKKLTRPPKIPFRGNIHKQYNLTIHPKNIHLWLPTDQTLKMTYKNLFQPTDSSYIINVLENAPQIHISAKYDAFTKNIYVKICQSLLSAITAIRQQLPED